VVGPSCLILDEHVLCNSLHWDTSTNHWAEHRRPFGGKWFFGEDVTWEMVHVEEH